MFIISRIFSEQHHQRQTIVMLVADVSTNFHKKTNVAALAAVLWGMLSGRCQCKAFRSMGACPRYGCRHKQRLLGYSLSSQLVCV